MFKISKFQNGRRKRPFPKMVVCVDNAQHYKILQTINMKVLAIQKNEKFKKTKLYLSYAVLRQFN